MDIQLAQIIFQMINFGLVLFVLTRFIYQPVLKMLNERKAKVAEAAQAANEILHEKENLAKIKRETLEQAQLAAKKIEHDAQAEAKKAMATLLEQSKVGLASKESKFEAELAKLKKEKLKIMDQDLKQAAVQIAEAVLQESIDAKKHQKIIDQQIKQITESL